MNLRDLKYFLALAETRHFGQAAARHFVSQPTLSGQIRKLEEELGGALFERSKKSVVITPLGALLLPCARRAVADASRRVSLVWRRSFPRPAAIEALADMVVGNLPKTVRCLEQT